MTNRIIIILVIILATLGYATYQALVLDDKLASRQIVEADSVISSLPQIELPEFKTNKNLKLSEVGQGKNTVVHFWATWCGPCEAEFPKFEKLFNQVDLENFSFVFITVNDKAEDVEKFLKRFPGVQSKVTLLVDDNNSSQNYFGTYKLPETFVFDRENSVVRKFTGPQDWDNDYFKSFFSLIK